jgi:hypothetical protein
MDQKSVRQIDRQDDRSLPVSVQQAIREFHPLPAAVVFQQATERLLNAFSGWEYFRNELEFE